jgi:hypothetical protein
MLGKGSITNSDMKREGYYNKYNTWKYGVHKFYGGKCFISGNH